LHKASFKQNGKEQTAQNNALKHDFCLLELDTSYDQPLRVECCSTEASLLKDGEEAPISTAHSSGLSSKKVFFSRFLSMFQMLIYPFVGWVQKDTSKVKTTSTASASIPKRSRIMDFEDEHYHRTLHEGVCSFPPSSFCSIIFSTPSMTARSFRENLSKVPANDARNDFKAKEHEFVLLPAHPSLPSAKQCERFWISAENIVMLMQRTN
jgi:hypothetical protein